MSASNFVLPRLYAILDVETLGRQSLRVTTTAVELVDAGVTLLQLRDKRGDPQRVLRDAKEIIAALRGSGCRLLLNDYADLVSASGADGVHVGQGDLQSADARRLVGPDRILGISTHNEEQMRFASAGTADYLAIGPVFGTVSKSDAAPIVGLAGVRSARSLTGKPLVAIGGITASNAREVLAAGADAVAVIGALSTPGRTVGENARALLDILASPGDE